MNEALQARAMDLAALVQHAWAVGRLKELAGCAYGPASAPFDRFVDHPLDYHRWLAGFAQVGGMKRVLDVGTHYGGSAIALVHGMRAGGVGPHKLATINTVSMNPDGLAAFGEIVPIIADGADPRVLNRALDALDSPLIDLVYVDALKDGAFVASVLESVTRRAMPRFVILDDIGKTDSMRALWEAAVERFGARAIDISSILPEVRSPDVGFGLIQVLPDDLPIRVAIGRGQDGDNPVSQPDKFPSIRSTPWRALSSALPEIQGVKGMMRPGETRLLNWLAKHFYSGEGEIVDAGPFLGRSTIALASGLRENPTTARKDRRIHSFDLFEISNETYRRLLRPGSEIGGSFLDEYMETIAPYGRYVNVYSGDLTTFRWLGQPIEIMFVDIAKSVALNSHVYTDFLPHLIPGRSVYVQQDYVHLGVPEVHVVLGFLIEHFTVIDVVVPSLVLAVESVPPPWKLERIAADDFSSDERVSFVERLEAVVPGPEAKGTTLLVAATLAAERGMRNRAATLFQRVLGEYAELDDKHYRNRIGSTHRKLRRLLPPGMIEERLPWESR